MATKTTKKTSNEAEEVELDVKQIEKQFEEAAKPLLNSGAQVIDLIRKTVLAGVGAVALSGEEAQSFVNRLVERGELAQKDAEKLMKEVRERVSRRAPVQEQATEIASQIENGLENLLNRLNVPSKRDIDELSAKIAQLAARVEELRLTQEVTPAKRTSVASQN